MVPYYAREQYDTAANYIWELSSHRPLVGIILGSGLNPLAEMVEAADRIPYGQIPNFPTPGVEGHMGQLVIGHLAGLPVLIMQGRVHFYEGYPIQQIGFPVRVMQVMGIETLIVTNAAGGLNPDLNAGELMLISDHINLMGMAGANPLFGPNDPTLGPRFPDMSQAYDRGLRSLAREVAAQEAIPLHEGVYAGLAGPSFETPADIRFLRMIGADAVGMSTVPEVIVARHGGIRVMGVSGISNVALGTASALGTAFALGEPAPGQEASHEEVLAAGKELVPRLAALLLGVLTRMATG